MAQQVVRESDLYSCTTNIYCTVWSLCSHSVQPARTCFIIMNAVTWSVPRWAVGEVRGPRARNLLIIRLNRLYILDTCVSPVSPACLVRVQSNTNKDIEAERLSLIITVFSLHSRLATPLSVQKLGS